MQITTLLQKSWTLAAGANREGSRGVGAAEDQYSLRGMARRLVEEGGGAAQRGVVGGKERHRLAHGLVELRHLLHGLHGQRLHGLPSGGSGGIGRPPTAAGEAAGSLSSMATPPSRAPPA